MNIIICTRNRATSLTETLKAIGQVTVPEDLDVELLVVDNGSTDATPDVAKSAVLPNMPLRYVLEKSGGQARARNRGLAETAGSVIVFTDDDVRPPSDWLERMCRPIIDGVADLVGGGVKIPGHLDRPWLQGQLRSWFAATDHLAPPTIAFVGANMAFSRRALESVPSFDEKLGPGALGGNDDYLFYLKAIAGGLRIASAMNCQVEHHFDPSRLTRTSILKQVAAYGRSAGYVAYHWQKMAFPRPRFQIARKKITLAAKRMLRRPWRQREGCAEWEYVAVLVIYMLRQYAVEATKCHQNSQPNPAAHGSISGTSVSAEGVANELC